MNSGNVWGIKYLSLWQAHANKTAVKDEVALLRKPEEKKEESVQQEIVQVMQKKRIRRK